MGRVAGHLINLNLGFFMLFLIMKHSPWSLLFKVFPFERSIELHRFVGFSIFWLVIFHMTTWWVTFPLGSHGWVCWGWTFGFRSSMFLGHMTAIFLGIMVFFSLNLFRRKAYEVFYYAHVTWFEILSYFVNFFLLEKMRKAFSRRSTLVFILAYFKSSKLSGKFLGKSHPFQR